MGCIDHLQLRVFKISTTDGSVLLADNSYMLLRGNKLAIRNGYFDRLHLVGRNGTVCLVTHATPKFANLLEQIKFFFNQPLKLELTCKSVDSESNLTFVKSLFEQAFSVKRAWDTWEGSEETKTKIMNAQTLDEIFSIWSEWLPD